MLLNQYAYYTIMQ